MYESTANAKIVLPDSFTLSGYHKLNEFTALMGTVQYIQWSRLQQVNIRNLASVTNSGDATVTNLNVSEKFHDAWRIALGSEHYWKANVLLRFGLGYEQDPSRVDERSVASSGNKYIAAVGASYLFNKEASLDFGFSHAYSERVSVNSSQDFSDITTYSDGRAQLALNEVGQQFNWAWA